ncbi:MAG: hypothetical protein RJB38_1351 [Pseudomonadota bacterium]
MQVLLTGANRGIGLEFAKQHLARGDVVLGVVRDLGESAELRALEKEFLGKLIILEAQVATEAGRQEITKVASSLNSIDLLIQNAGVYPEGETEADFTLGFQVNTIAPYLLTKSLLPFLRKAANPKVALITSMMGSIADNESAGSVAYRASKCALNMVGRCLSIEESDVTTLLLHPGWVKTRMGGPEALITTTESVSGLLKVIIQAQKSDSGAFFDYEGERLPW